MRSIFIAHRRTDEAAHRLGLTMLSAYRQPIVKRNAWITAARGMIAMSLRMDRLSKLIKE